MTVVSACKFCRATNGLVAALSDKYGAWRCANLQQCAKRMARARAKASYDRRTRARSLA